MILLIDAGNSRIKWGVFEAGTWLAEGAVAHCDVPRLVEVAARFPSVSRIVGANVAGPEVAARLAGVLASLGPRPEWIRPRVEGCGVRNLYEDPAQLGADRWAALIGTRALRTGASLVVMAGTATTVDLLDSDGVFLGGVILPGERLMRAALAQNTAQLPFLEGTLVRTPRNTSDAIVSGCAQAQAGAIERMFREFDGQQDPRCVLSGGAAALLVSLLDIPCTHVDNLVLKGLARIAERSNGQDSR